MTNIRQGRVRDEKKGSLIVNFKNKPREGEKKKKKNIFKQE